MISITQSIFEQEIAFWVNVHSTLVLSQMVFHMYSVRLFLYTKQVQLISFTFDSRKFLAPAHCNYMYACIFYYHTHNYVGCYHCYL